MLTFECRAHIIVKISYHDYSKYIVAANKARCDKADVLYHKKNSA